MRGRRERPRDAYRVAENQRRLRLDRDSFQAAHPGNVKKLFSIRRPQWVMGKVPCFCEQLIARSGRRKRLHVDLSPRHPLFGGRIRDPRDLTGLDIKVGIDPSSDSVGGEGFTNVGDVQFVQDESIERYLESAKLVADHAVIGSGPLEFCSDPGKTGLELSALNRINDHGSHGRQAGSLRRREHAPGRPVDLTAFRWKPRGVDDHARGGRPAPTTPTLARWRSAGGAQGGRWRSAFDRA